MKKLRDMINGSNEKLVKDKINTLQVYCEYFSNYDTLIITDKYNEDRRKAWKDMHNFASLVNASTPIIDMTSKEIYILLNALLWMTDCIDCGYWKDRLYYTLLTLYTVSIGADPYWNWNIGTTLECLNMNKF